MGIFASQLVDARCGVVTGRADDPCATQTRLRKGRCRWIVACLIGVSAVSACADTYRIATFSAPLSRDGPGLLLRDITNGDDPQIAAIAQIVIKVAPDILVLTDFDFDLDQRALSAFAEMTGFPIHFSLPPNSGVATGLDMNGDGYLGDAEDAQGFGKFAGDGGMAILSNVPINGVQDFSDVLWSNLPGAVWPVTETGPFPDSTAFAIQRLSSTGHWAVQFAPEGQVPFHVLAFSATPPVFDGPEDQNGLRNRDELRLISQMVETVPGGFVIAGNANLDPVDGQGYPDAMADFLRDSRIIDTAPRSEGAADAADPEHLGDPALDTVDWPDGRPGNLRVSYVLPSTGWSVAASGVFWPKKAAPEAALLGSDGLAAGPHRLVWVDVER